MSRTIEQAAKEYCAKQSPAFEEGSMDWTVEMRAFMAGAKWAFEAGLRALDEIAKLRAGLEEISRVEWVRMTYVDDKQWMEALVRALNSNAAVARKALGRE